MSAPPDSHAHNGKKSHDSRCAKDEPSAAENSPSHPNLRAYFLSGWAFLIPYLVTYLLYAWLKWPVNAVTGEGAADGIGNSAGILPSAGNTLLPSGFHPPCLLHVYWFLHGLHLVLCTPVIVSWWRRPSQSPPPTADCSPSSVRDQQSMVDRLWPIMPWFCLALLFYIPGAYMEFPSDPWEHYTRINEWAHDVHVGDHYYSVKFSYFLVYSILGQAHGTQQFFWLDFYYTGICLLLCWQYYKLARAAGLNSSTALLFIFLQSLFFGNTIFSFYRYYGISSTLFSQLAAIAMIRISLETMDRMKTCKGAKKISISMIIAAGKIGSLLLLIRFSHIQGFGIGLLGSAAVAGAYAIGRWSSLRWWLPLAALGLSIVTIYAWPRHPALDDVYRPAGWMTRWYGFNFIPPFSTHSPAADRTLQILGIFGLCNFVAGLILLFRNHVVGWLTVFPVLTLCLPVVAIPLANALAHYDAASILTFHRMFLGIPVGLALAALAQQCLATRHAQEIGRRRLSYSFLFLSGALAAAMVVPATGPYYNRIWNSLMTVPNDLRMSHVVTEAAIIQRTTNKPKEHAPYLITPLGVGFISYASGDRNISGLLGFRSIFPHVIPAENLKLYIQDIFNTEGKQYTRLMIPPTMALVSPYSMSGYLSQHWAPQQVALDHIAAPELEAVALRWGAKKIHERGFTYYIFSRPAAK